ncbi:hypothetical protein [Clostridium ihumii]|uniref:hypothetical protein n=1 Tax=Clostridium ihumii TaxID=1470356 RepID=UPI00058F5628|nr:hypothetical protein [Clostridium ihumii]
MKGKNLIVISIILASTLGGTALAKGGNVEECKYESGKNYLMENYVEEKHSYKFPNKYQNEFEKITFEAEVIVENVGELKSFYKCNAKPQRINRDKALKKFLGKENIKKVYESQEDVKGETTSVSYEGENGNTISFGDIPSSCNYRKNGLSKYLLNAFRLQSKDSRYNADKFSLDKEFEFSTREEAFDNIKKMLTDIGIEIGSNYKAYSLDYKTMRDEEYVMDVNGNEDRSKYKPSWTEEDNAYYFVINQDYEKLPTYHPYFNVFKSKEESNAPIQVIYSKNGIEYLEIENVVDFSSKNSEVEILPFENIIESINNKAFLNEDDRTFKVTKMELEYMVDTYNGRKDGIYKVKPIWMADVEEVNKEYKCEFPIIIDAATGQIIDNYCENF